MTIASRHDIVNKLQGETLVRKGLMSERSGIKQLHIAPELSVVKIGGHGTIDFGAPVVIPLLKEIGDLSINNQMLVVTGGGVRVRHILDIGIDLGMPTGVLAELAGKISEQNAIMVATLLSKYNGVRIHTADLLEIPTLLKMGLLPVTHGTPPYGLYEQPPRVGTIPPNRTDTGAFLAAEVLGAKNCILVKNVDGLYTENPIYNPDAEFIPEITAGDLLALDLEDLVLERAVLEIMQNASNIREVKIVNGHVPGNVEKVIRGEKVGTIIRAD